jgi:hypothetical protein
MKKILTVLIVAMAALVGCGKDKGNNNNNGYYGNGGYGYDRYGYGNRFGGGNCGYGNRFGGNGGGVYQWRNNYCVDTRYNRQVAERFCDGAGFGGGNGGGFGCFNNGSWNNGWNNGFNNVGFTSPQCQYLARPGFYYMHYQYPGTGQFVCLEFSSYGNAYTYGQPAYNVGNGFGFYGYIRL